MLKDLNVKVQDVLSLIDDFKRNNHQTNKQNENTEMSAIVESLLGLAKPNEIGFIHLENSLLKSILNSIPALISYIDTKFIYQFVNLSYETWFGLSVNDILGKSMDEILGEEGIFKVKNYLDRAFLGEQVKFEIEMSYRLSGFKDVLTTYIPDFAPDGSVRGIFVIVNDLSDVIKSNRELTKSKTEFETVLNSVPSMIAQWDLELKNVEANKAYKLFFCRSPKSIQGQHQKDIIGEVLFLKMLPYIERVLQGETLSFEMDVCLEDGSNSFGLVSYVPNIINGVVQGYFVTITDVSELKKTNQNILKQKNYYSQILNSMHESVIIIDDKGILLNYNEPAAKLFGFSEDFISKKIFRFSESRVVTQNGNDLFLSNDEGVKLLAMNKPNSTAIFEIQNQNNRNLWIKSNSVPFQRELDSKLSATLITFTDVTTEFEKDEVISSMIMNSPGMIYTFKLSVEGEMSFDFVSPKAYDIYEISPEDFKENPKVMVEMVHPAERDNLLSEIFLSAERNSIFEWRGRIISKSGKIKWISAKSTPHKDFDGGTHWDGIVIDITHEVLLEKELNLEKSKAAHSAKLVSLGQISAGVAHEINNPLTIITGMSRMIKNSLDSPEKVTSSLLSINNSVERISKIVMGLQKFARINNQVKRELHQLNSIIKETDVITQIKSKHNMINFEVESSSTSFINCDSIEIEQVLINLTNNAMDAVKNQSERWVKVKVFDRDNHVVVQVTDSGSKITPEDALKLFDPFFTTKNVGEGTGLGLSIAQGIIKAHHGELSYLPDNPYTCFEFTLPIYN